MNLSVRHFQSNLVPCPRSVAIAQGVDWKSAAIDIELGCGAGLHPLRYTLENPGRTLFAIEHTRTRFGTFERAFEKARQEAPSQRAGLVPVHANAIGWITHAVPDASVERFFLLYPNPNPKSQDLNKRWHAMPFMRRILAVLKEGGTLQLATNERFYMDEARLYFREFWKVNEIAYRELGRDFAADARTHFEKKYLERGETCFDLVVQKPAGWRAPD